MTPAPMLRWQNAVALAATLFAAGALLPLEPRVRIVMVALAVAVIVLLLVVRLRAHGARRDGARVSGVYDRIERIRKERAKRGGR